jgi:hypothetical protein
VDIETLMGRLAQVGVTTQVTLAGLTALGDAATEPLAEIIEQLATAPSRR